MALIEGLRKRLSHGKACPVDNVDCQLYRNVGADLLEWPDRTRLAFDMLMQHLGAPLPGMRLGDLGCGRQTLRGMLPADWVYLPFDYCRRSEDTGICDLNADFPQETFDTVVVLGVLEYLDRPEAFLASCIGNCRYLLFSYNGHTTDERRRRQGWKNNLTFQQIEQVLNSHDSSVLDIREIGNNERIYLAQGGKR